jgi:hypothetical protein
MLTNIILEAVNQEKERMLLIIEIMAFLATMEIKRRKTIKLQRLRKKILLHSDRSIQAK